MFELIDWIRLYQKTKEEQYFKRILNQVETLMIKTSKRVEKSYREDLIQELTIGTFDVISKITIFENRLDKSLFTTENYISLMADNFSIVKVYQIFHNDYLCNFLNQIEFDLFIHSFTNEQAFLVLDDLFMKYNAQNQFFFILQKRYTSILASFYRKNRNYFSLEVKLLNRPSPKGNEYVESIEDKSSHSKAFLEQYEFTTEEKNFLYCFIEGNYVLTQQEVAQKIGTSQQNVSKKLSAIKKKYQFQLYK